MQSSGEDDLIATFFAPLAGEGGLALKDDAALLVARPGHDLVITCDALVAGVHFFPEDPAQAVAAKALRVNLSDLAAKGAEPAGFVVALALPRRDDLRAWVADFAEGLRRDIESYGCPLLGGDTVSTPGPAMISITAFGHVREGQMVPRTGARAGDFLYVSGTIGDAALGLQSRLGALDCGSADKAVLEDRYLLPRPRLALREALARCAHAAMDLSDGLVGDLSKMMRVSGVSAKVEAAKIPLSAAARRVAGADFARLETMVSGGDDYEILAAIAPDRAAEFEAQARAADVAVTRIGEVVAGRDAPVFTSKDGAVLTFARRSYSHF